MSRLGRVAGLRMTACAGGLGALLGLAGLIGIPELGAVVPAAAAGPSAIATSPVTSSGQLERVSGSGWDDVGGVVTVQICGQDAVNLTSDCDEANTMTRLFDRVEPSTPDCTCGYHRCRAPASSMSRVSLVSPARFRSR